jgi:predicted nuclease of predicted toxin-antitoxin system
MEPQVGHRLEAYGHTIESVEDISGLGLGATDTEIATYSKETESVILTYDDDFLTEHEPADYHCVIFFADESLSATQVSDIIHEMAETYPESAFTGPQFGSTEWL